MNTPLHAVVLAVGDDGYDAALAFAVAEAERRQYPLHLVHVLELPPGEAYSGVYGGALEEARTTLDAATRAARDLSRGNVPVTSEIFDSGWIVDDLVRRTEGASCLVVQHRALGKVARLLTGSIAQRVAGKAHVPVYSVPEHWSPEAPPKGFITVAVQDAAEAAGLLRLAFEEARARGTRLVVLHAWWLASGYDTVLDEVVRDDFATRARAEIGAVLDPLRTDFADVEALVTVEHAPPVEGVLDAAERSDLVIIGRRHHLLPVHSHLGPVARGALDRAECPVLLAPEHLVPEVEAIDEARTAAPAPA